MVRTDTRPRQLHYDAAQVVESFPRSYLRGDDDFDQLVFALKYDGVHPYALVKIFQSIDLDALARRIAAQPTSQYARRIMFFCEQLAGLAPGWRCARSTARAAP